MGKIKILDWIRMVISNVAWLIFLWSSGLTDEEYWTKIYEQEKVLLQGNGKKFICQYCAKEYITNNKAVSYLCSCGEYCILIRGK